MTRILQVCAVDFTAYHLLRPLLHATRARGWDAEFACADGQFAERLRTEGFRHWRVPITRSASPVRLVQAAASLASQLRGRGADLVHTHTPVGGLVGRTATLAWRGPVVHTFHGLPFEGAPRTPVERAFLTLERILARRTTSFFSQASGDADRAASLGIARPKDTTVIGNGVDLDRFRPDAAVRKATRDAHGLAEDAAVAIIVARLVREKGLIELADAALACADIRTLHVLVVGESLPSDRTAVTAELDAHPVTSRLGPRWRRLGHRDDIAALLAAADMFVLPTYREGLPRSVIEAMASALPVVTTTIPACRELVNDGDNGLLVPPRDPRALASAMRRLAIDGAVATSMGRRSREIAEARHDERAVIAREISVFERLLGQEVHSIP